MMKGSLKAFMALVLLFGINGNASAVDNHWLGTAGDNEWNNATNWQLGHVPDAVTYPDEEAEIGNTTVGAGPILGVGDVGSAYRLFLGQSDGATWYGEIQFDGGTLTTSGYWSAAYHAGTSALITMNSGTVYIGDPLGANGHLYLGREGSAIFNMNGGDFTVDDMLELGKYVGGYGEINLAGGTLTASTLQFSAGTGHIDITGGILLLNGDDTDDVAGYHANGWITGYGSEDNVLYDYNITTPGKTTVWAIPEPATICLLAIGALGLLRRK